MTARLDETLPLACSDDVVRARQLVRAIEIGFGLVDQTKLVTAASELARNTVTHGGGGTLRLEPLGDGHRAGLRMIFEDHGPGIANVAQALQDGYSSAGGLGLGLGGARRLVNEFEILSRLGEGTRVIVSRWK